MFQDGAITRLAISVDEKHIGFANGRGIVTVTATVDEPTGSHSLVTSKEHQNNEVTSMIWRAGNMLFCGDDVGRISVLQLQSFIVSFNFVYDNIINIDLFRRNAIDIHITFLFEKRNSSFKLH